MYYIIPSNDIIELVNPVLTLLKSDHQHKVGGTQGYLPSEVPFNFGH